MISPIQPAAGDVFSVSDPDLDSPDLDTPDEKPRVASGVSEVDESQPFHRAARPATTLPALETDHESVMSEQSERRPNALWNLQTQLMRGYFTLLVIMGCIGSAILGGVAAAIYISTLHSGQAVTFPPSEPRLGYQRGPSGRSTANIVSACVATMVTCVVTSVHFSIPPTFAKERSFWTKLLTGDWSTFVRKIGWWIGGLLAPEVIVCRAALEYADVQIEVAQLREEGITTWTQKHAFFAKMGGFLLPNGRTLLVRGERLYGLDGSEPPQGIDPDKLDHRLLLKDIDDKSKANPLAKSLVVLQISRFLAQTIARAAKRLPISPLEYTTCAYVVCTCLIYALWWNKPYNAQRPLFLQLYCRGSDQSRGRSGRKRFSRRRSKGDTGIFTADSSRYWFLTVSTSIAALLLGAGHLASWNIGFPNSNGQVLWRVCALIATSTSLVLIVLSGCMMSIYGGGILMRSIVLVNVLAYLLARLLLLFLLVYSFKSLPAGVYETKNTDWLEFIPFLQ